MGVIAETTDRVAVMKNGHLVEIGSTKKILTEPKETYTKSLVSSVPQLTKNNKIYNYEKKINQIKIKILKF